MRHLATSLLLLPAVHALPPTRLFVCGLGYAGSRVASLFHDRHPSCHIAGCVRSAERAEEVRAAYPWLDAVHVFDLDENYEGLTEEGLSDLLSASHIVREANGSRTVASHSTHFVHSHYRL